MSSPDPYTEPHFDRSALLIIDTQNDFLDGGASPIAGTRERLPQMRELLESYREAGRPIVHVVRIYEGDDIDLVRRQALERVGKVVRAGSDGVQIPADLVPGTPFALDTTALLHGETQPVGPGEIVLWKPRWSAFFRTPLKAYLDEREVDTVVVAGCNFPNCPRATIFDASELDLRVVIATDALSGMTPERLNDAVAIGVRPMATAEVVRRLSGCVPRR